MKNLGKKHCFILFTLGKLYEELNSKLNKRYLQIAVPKYVFIDLVMKANITEKKSRALYKNLQTLEKQKYISYAGRNLALTPKGIRMYRRIVKEHEPYINVMNILAKENILRFSKKSQTMFKLA